MEEVHFRKAPVVEISVQVQWLPVTQVATPPQSTVIQLEGENFFSNFASKAATVGFTQSERLIPLGAAPLVPYQPVYRYRMSDPTIIYQLGQGMFSVHAVPPYRTWEHFSPHVTQGLSMMLASLPPQQKVGSFLSVQVRYVNIFEGEVLNGVSPTKFILDTLGWRINPPAALQKNLDTSTAEGIFARSGFKVSDSVQLLVSTGEVLRNDTSVALLDLMTEMKNVEHSQQAVVSATESMHTVIHGTFLEMITPIRDLLEPVRGEQ